MFSFLRNHGANLPNSQRFYYENYDYYNVYEHLERAYKDDLSKFIFNCSRRSRPIIANYPANINYLRFPHDRLLKGLDNQSMETFINPFLYVLLENNYTSVQHGTQIQNTLEMFQYLEFGKVRDTKYQNFSQFKMILLSQDDLVSEMGILQTLCAQRIQQLQEAYETNAISVYKLQCYIAFELYANKILSSLYCEDKDQASNASSLLYEFTVQVHRLMWEIVNARMRTILLLSQPKIPFLNNLIHPLVIPLTSFLKYFKIQQAAQFTTPATPLLPSVGFQCPRIAFINLDGKQNAQNLRNMKALNNMGDKNFMYVSLFSEPSWLKKISTNIDKFATEEEIDISFQVLCQIYEEQILKEFVREDSGCESSDEENRSRKMLLFPLDSPLIFKKYLIKYYENCHNRKNQKRSGIYGSVGNKKPEFPRIQSPQDIHFLFQHIILQEIRRFRPTMIFISYNGQLNISEDYFNDIIRQCSIISDHRVILFPNFTHFFNPGPMPIPEEDLKDENVDKIMCANEFYDKYFGFDYQEINLQRMYANISNFLKQASGIYNMGQKVFGTPFSKYNMQNRYNYLQVLKALPEFSYLNKYYIGKWSADQLGQIYDQLGQWEIKQNKKQSQYYEKLITTVISEFLCLNISQDQLEKILDIRLFYRRKLLAGQLLKSQQAQKSVLKTMIRDCTGQDPQEMDEEEQVNPKDLLSAYLNKKKENLLLENHQNYKTRKYYYMPESQRAFGHVNCFRFTLGNKDDGEEINLQRYSQIIVNDDKEDIFIINYRTQENRHIILSGCTKNGQLQKNIVVSEVKIDESQLSEQFYKEFQHQYLTEEGLIAQKQDLLYVQYNYCFIKRVLYLFWPLAWNLKEQVRCKLLGCEYKPKRVFKMIRITQSSDSLSFGDNKFIYENILYRPDKSAIQAFPRWGCTCHAIDQNNFLIFGGIYDNENDYRFIGTGIASAHIQTNERVSSFTINGTPKTNSDGLVKTCLRPKINFQSKDAMLQKIPDNKIRLRGGYGRQYTSFFSLFSYDEYEIDIGTEIKPRMLFQQRKTRRIVNPENPISINKIGKYIVVMNNHNFSQCEQKFSDLPKEKFIFERKNDTLNKVSDWEVFSFIDQNYRISSFKTDSKKAFLFGFNRTIREKIFSRHWSPELYIVEGIKESIINICLKTEKLSNFMLANYLMPREDDIVSLCLDEDKLFLLSNSPIIHSIDRSGVKFILYEGSLSNINDVLKKQEIPMGVKFTFSERCEQFLNDKTIFIHDEKIYVVGGQCIKVQQMDRTVFEREDYILEKYKNKFKAKTRKIQSADYNLDMPQSVVVQCPQYYLLYSIVYEEVCEQMTEEYQAWKLKVEKFSLEPNNCEDAEILIGEFKAYFFNYKDGQVQRYPRAFLQKPKFVSIVPYERFNMQKLKEGMSKIIWRLSQPRLFQIINAEEITRKILEQIKDINEERNDQVVVQYLLQKQAQIFDDLIFVVRKKMKENSQIQIQGEELLKDLKFSYCLANKLILQHKICAPHPMNPNEKEYRFVVEDKPSKKVKYIAIGNLQTTKLNFFRIRFKYELLLSLNQNNDDWFFFHPMNLACEKQENDNISSQNNSEYPPDQKYFPLQITFKQ